MTYQTPELLLVGAAQNLVLSGIPTKAEDFNRDAPGQPAYGNSPVELSW